jgi:hypothetical protein
MSNVFAVDRAIVKAAFDCGMSLVQRSRLKCGDISNPNENSAFFRTELPAWGT